MLWSVIRVIFKTSSVTPDFFYVFNLVLSFSTCSQSFNKICVWEVLGANVLKLSVIASCEKDGSILSAPRTADAATVCRAWGVPPNHQAPRSFGSRLTFSWMRLYCMKNARYGPESC